MTLGNLTLVVALLAAILVPLWPWNAARWGESLPEPDDEWRVGPPALPRARARAYVVEGEVIEPAAPRQIGPGR